MQMFNKNQKEFLSQIFINSLNWCHPYIQIKVIIHTMCRTKFPREWIQSFVYATTDKVFMHQNYLINLTAFYWRKNTSLEKAAVLKVLLKFYILI